MEKNAFFLRVFLYEKAPHSNIIRNYRTEKYKYNNVQCVWVRLSYYPSGFRIVTVCSCISFDTFRISL